MYQGIPGAGVTLSATTSGAAGSFPNNAGINASGVYISVSGFPAAIRMGKGAQTAVAADTVIGAGQGIFLAKGQGVDGVAAIGIGGTATVTFSPVDGNTY